MGQGLLLSATSYRDDPESEDSKDNQLTKDRPTC